MALDEGRHGAQAVEAEFGAAGLAGAVAEGYFKLLSYKDEYEVARLHAQTLDTALGKAFDHVGKVTYHLAPPLLGRKDSEGRPVKSEFGPWMARAFRILARFKFLRGTPFDPFGRTAERRMERRMIRDYETLMGDLLGSFDAANAATLIELARLPLKVRGFGHVKMANAQNMAEERDVLLELFRSGEPPVTQAADTIVLHDEIDRDFGRAGIGLRGADTEPV